MTNLAEAANNAVIADLLPRTLICTPRPLQPLPALEDVALPASLHGACATVPTSPATTSIFCWIPLFDQIVGWNREIR
ncbi:MAG: hypothetical protein HOP03_08625 [Lysobacter sp.]|nr:hypothetical protein [Lysobacter sp.]